MRVKNDIWMINTADNNIVMQGYYEDIDFHVMALWIGAVQIFSFDIRKVAHGKPKSSNILLKILENKMNKYLGQYVEEHAKNCGKNIKLFCKHFEEIIRKILEEPQRNFVKKNYLKNRLPTMVQICRLENIEHKSMKQVS